MDNLDPNGVLRFLEYVNELKHLPRRGWTQRNIRDTETISGHMYGMAMMTLLMSDDSKLDKFKCLQLALVHDLAEAIVGDITPFDGVNEDVKHEKEDKAMQEITRHIGSAGENIYNLYKEYAAKQTEEAKFVKDLDRFDFLFTGASYEKRDKILEKTDNIFNTFRSETYNNAFVRKLALALEESRANQYR